MTNPYHRFPDKIISYMKIVYGKLAIILQTSCAITDWVGYERIEREDLERQDNTHSTKPS